VLKRGGDRRLCAGHPWIYRSEIADVQGPVSPGDVVEIASLDGRFLGRGYYNPRPALSCRMLTRRRDEAVDAELVLRRLALAKAYRRLTGLEADAYRLCWSEADGLPGLIVDRYATISVVQCLTLGMVRMAAWVNDALEQLFPGQAIHRTDDPTAARIEGFVPLRSPEPVPGEGADEDHAGGSVVITEGECRFAVDLPAHKTGFYLDQRENRLLVAVHAAGRRLLDAFCYTGAFACHGLRAGAREAVLIDSSPGALRGARRNLELNGVAARAHLQEQNAFDGLRALETAGQRFGLIVLDPPPFTRRKNALEAASRGYKEINLRGLRLLEAGGLLATFSCSHHVTPALFEGICRGAAGDAGVGVRVLAVLSQSRDHPVLLTVPETRYLTGLLLQAV
jgi:23S rRNA (cytosine1962-C5)-methyltransferase